MATRSPASRSEQQSQTRTAIGGDRAPRLPHEHDESSDSGGSAPRDVIRQAHDDVESGKTETDRGEVTDEVYRKTLKDAPAKG